jgi:signal transduction histidine kinase
MASGIRLRGAGQDRQTWLALLFVLVAVLAPTGCVLWFMNAAAKAQAQAARQSVAEAWRGQLRFIRDRVEVWWEARAASLDRVQTAPADFARAVTSGLADSVVFTGADHNELVAPSDPAIDRPEWNAAQLRSGQAAIGAWSAIAKADMSPSIAARAAQAEIRWLLRGSDKAAGREAAIGAIGEYFSGGRLARAADLEGRLIAADEQLLALDLMSARDGRRGKVVRRLVAMLNDYDNTHMPSVQRLFLMDEVRAKTPETVFPTFDAEQLAAQVAEAGESRGGMGLQSTRLAGVWSLAAKSGRVIALYRTNTVTAMLRGITEAKGAQITAVPPGARIEDNAIAAGPMLPGWQLTIPSVNSTVLDEAARSRMAAFLWVGYIAIGALAILGLLVGQSFRKQMRLARLKTDLVGAVSHELKTPLASMRLLVDSLLEDEKPDAARTRDYLRLIAGENARLTRLVENFLTFSRLERSGPRLERRRVAPAEIVESAAAVAQERFQSADFTVEVEPGLPALDADPDALLSALLNLLDNAWKYTRDNKQIRLRAYRAADEVVFGVADNGIGIAARDQTKIFRRFYQVDQRLARETGGCGLGLSIVDSIVRAHGGSVRVSSQPGAGSTFSLSLPGLRS